jgi:hypothetical protein
MDLSQKAGDATGAADSPEAFLTIAQLARRWLTSQHRLYLMRKTGEGPLFIIIGRCGVRYPVDAVLDYEAKRSFRSTAEFLSADRKRARRRRGTQSRSRAPSGRA